MISVLKLETGAAPVLRQLGKGIFHQPANVLLFSHWRSNPKKESGRS